MRNFSLIISMLLLVAVVLTACGGGATSTNVVESPPPVTVDATEDMSGTATESLTQEGTMTETPGVPVTGGVNPARLSNQLDFNVWNQNGEQIGEVNDMVVDLDNSTISYVIVGTGGFLEIGEKDVLVPWSSLQLQTSTGDTTGGEQNAFIFQGDQERFNNAPDVDVSATLPDRGTSADDWDFDIRNYWESGVLPATDMPEATADTSTTATMDAVATAEVATTPGAAALQGIILASELLDSDIVVAAQADRDVAGEGSAEATALPDVTPTVDTDLDNTVPEDVDVAVDDVIVDVDSGEILYIVVDASFEDSGRWIPVPLNFVQWSANDGVYTLNIGSTALRDAPSFQNGQYPDITVDGWNSDFDAYWQGIEPGVSIP